MFNHKKVRNYQCSRRSFLCRSFQVVMGLCVCNPFKGHASQFRQPASLNFYHTHTHDSLTIHLKKGIYKDPVIRKINYFLRDFRTQEVYPIDLRLLDLLCQIKHVSGSEGVFEVISGYRSPTTNKKLRMSSVGVAKKSLHMSGKAIDVRINDLPTRFLRDVAWSLQKGGVGYYEKSDFVHLDIGRVRRW
jgi:uncharacterized protein YcbK (DUF882 family)